MSPRPTFLFFLFVAFAILAADPPAVRPIPPPGIAVPDADRKELETGLATLEKAMDDLRTASHDNKSPWWPADVQIFHKAVDWALRYDEFFDAKQITTAKAQLALAMQRIKELREGKPSWKTAGGLVVRGYFSKIDGSVQPYGLVMPEDWKPGEKKPRRLDIWLHGRGEKLSELAFLDDRMKNKGEFTPPGAIVLHLYGRFCCANKFAGEADLFEALKDVQNHYPIDANRIVIRGFSMGGASAWQFATHHAAMWAAAAPGAGFAETAEFFKVFAPGKEPPPWWEQVLWRWYDSTLYATNLANCPTVAYSGEIDGQKQAADIMIRYAEKEGVTIPHIIGPQTAHKYHPEAKPKIEEFVTAAVTKGRETNPRKIRFVTYSLIYPEMAWVQLIAMEKQWERAEVDAEIGADGVLRASTKNVSILRFGDKGARLAPWKQVIVDGQTIGTRDAVTMVALSKQGKKWDVASDKSRGVTQIPSPFNQWDSAGDRLTFDSREMIVIAPRGASTTKNPLTCGPIDHAFMDRFTMVRPTGKPMNETVGTWAQSELEHALGFWGRVFRGDAPVKDDSAINADDIAKSNLILWGDPSSNAVLGKIIGKLPLQWTVDGLDFNGVRYDAAHHAPILIFPNPLNPKRYVVLNSGVTFREQALLNNSDQTPKLPDWAIVDLRTPPGPKWPGLVVDAGFFDEQWQLPARK